MGVGRDVRALNKAGAEFPVEISLSTVKIRGSIFVWSAIRSTRDRDLTLSWLRKAVKNKLVRAKGIVSICAWCKKILDERGSWLQLERYLESHTRIQFTHGICPGCLSRLDPAKQKSGDLAA
jgi:hypothetical protein